jgi:hypothetical protein
MSCLNVVFVQYRLDYVTYRKNVTILYSFFEHELVLVSTHTIIRRQSLRDVDDKPWANVVHIKTSARIRYRLDRVFAISSCASRSKKLFHVSIRDQVMKNGEETYLYHKTVGTTVPKCHKLCASTMPFQGGKSINSMLIATMIQATQRPGHTAHVRPIRLYCT